jgi:excisionase family DNA binding protein
LLSVDEVAILLGASRSSIYRSIERGDLPLPAFKINGRIRIARRAVERLLAGERPFVFAEDRLGAASGPGDNGSLCTFDVDERQSR